MQIEELIIGKKYYHIIPTPIKYDYGYNKYLVEEATYKNFSNSKYEKIYNFKTYSKYYRNLNNIESFQKEYIEKDFFKTLEEAKEEALRRTKEQLELHINNIKEHHERYLKEMNNLI